MEWATIFTFDWPDLDLASSIKLSKESLVLRISFLQSYVKTKKFLPFSYPIPVKNESISPYPDEVKLSVKSSAASGVCPSLFNLKMSK